MVMHFLSLLRKSFRQWQDDKAPQLAASTAYYTVFSLAPLLIILLGIAGLFFDPATVETQMFVQLRGLLGNQGADAVETMLTAAHASGKSTLATLIGVGTLVLGATGLFIALQDAMNFIWKVEVKKGTNALWLALLKRIFSLGLLLSICFLLLVSLVVSTLVTVVIHSFSAYIPFLPALLSIAHFVLSFGLILVLFALLFKYLPDVTLKWRDVWAGSAITSLLFTIGKSVLSWYLGSGDFASAYGAAGSLIVILLWVNYSAQILFFGVEFTKAYAERREHGVKPRPFARFS